ncbi:universal stress protein [Paenibacillus sp. ACRRX]|uniref:universal stress protein n=1 Tax=unclassified Paenibacillus TaxID=185978 RepID=UPI001EF6D53E|nr:MULTISPECIES: universal stress protein [unclassified Paenibacillus]MCG7409520.1 universal stress protein [Paenibacillus sp. ACRRX]MDK8183407.1 universal stress protein [Paenibacillus sp. UMB4589-SE434]
MAFTNVLVAYDGSEPSRSALKHALSMAEASGEVRVHVVHIFQLPQYFLGDAFSTASPQVNQEVYEYAQQIEQHAREQVSFLGDRAAVELLQGPPGQAVIKYAEQHKCDLIILGSRGLSGLREFVLGSVSHYVVQTAKIPVLVMKS